MWGKRFAWGALASALACGGTSPSGGIGGGEATCSAVTACGGDIVGTWTIVSGCAHATGTTAGQNGCTDTVNDTASGFAGSETFNADGTYTNDYSAVESDTVGLDAACLSVNGTTLTCEQVSGVLDADLMATQAGVTLSPWTCASAAGAGCSCGASVTYSHTMTSGTYTTVGSALTETPAGGTAIANSYCVVGGSELHVIPTAQEMGNLAPGVTLTGELVLTRQ